MKIAIVGCAHGEIEEIITTIQQFEIAKKCKVDLLIVCGDFQAVRNEHDLATMSCPAKYKQLHTFYKYYSGELKAPFPILCIGGNHEASNYFLELYHGGWLAPNIYYLGASGSVFFGGLRISGISGIFKKHDFNKGQHETLPLNKNGIYSSYHIRRFNIWKLNQLHSNSIDIMLSHEWPSTIWEYGNYQNLIKFKPHFTPDINNGHLGNPALNHLLFQLQPKQWLSGHLHVKYSAIVKHKDTENVTRFLASDKFDSKNKRRKFVQMLDFAPSPTASKPFKFEYDPVWLAIIKSTNKFLSTDLMHHPYPEINNKSNERWDFRPNQQEIDEIMLRFDDNLTIDPNLFEKILETPANPNDPKLKYVGKSPRYVNNPQTIWLMNKLGIKDKLSEKHKMIYSLEEKADANPYGFNTKTNTNDDEIFQWIETRKPQKRAREIEDPNEIDIDLDSPSKKRTTEVEDPNEIKIGLDSPSKERTTEVEDPNEIDID